ncbi:MAG: BMC domain-containing protein [bacterium]
MKRYPAIALIEYSNVASGIHAGDAMIKRAPIAMLRTGTVSQGKYLVLIGGEVAPVEEAFAEGVSNGGESVVDCVILPQVHDQVYDAVLGMRMLCRETAVGIVDTRTVSAIIRCSDAAVKGAAIDIVEMRLGDQLGGKAFAIYNGCLEDVEAAVAIAKERDEGLNSIIRTTIVPKLDSEMAKQIDTTTQFNRAVTQTLSDGEREDAAR